MKRFAIIAVLLSAICFSGFAQEEEEPLPDGWHTGGAASFGLTFTGLQNWSAGGVNSVSGLLTGNLFANYKQGKHKWDNSLNVQYGLTALEGDAFSPRKNADLLDINSIYGYELADKWYLSSLFNFRTQFVDGYAYVQGADGADSAEVVNSALFAPAYINFGIGAEYKPTDNFSLYLSPAHMKATIVANETLRNTVVDSAANLALYGVTVGESSVVEVGALARMHYHTNLAENVFFTTDINLFYDYLTAPPEGFPVDIDWQAGLTTTVLKYININLFGHLIYDADIYIVDDQAALLPDGSAVYEQAGVQLRGVLGIGIGYTFNNESKLRAK